MKIFLNGEGMECEDARTIGELIARHQLAPETTLVEHTGVALRRREWPNEKLQENDRVEILRVAAGGLGRRGFEPIWKDWDHALAAR